MLKYNFESNSQQQLTELA